MIHLQNNFTTPEQSKRLLELGVPADSADCYYEKSASLSGDWEYKPYIGECVAIKQNLFSYRNRYVIPCWSVGRLIDIYEICTSQIFDRMYIDESILDDVYSQIIEEVISTDECWDFSKLEG